MTNNEEKKETEKLVLSLSEAAKALSCSLSCARKLVLSKELKAFKVGNRYKVYAEEIKEYVKRNEV